MDPKYEQGTCTLQRLESKGKAKTLWADIQMKENKTATVCFLSFDSKA